MPETNHQGTTAYEFQEWMRNEDVHSTFVHRRLKPEPVLSEVRDMAPIGGTGSNLYFPRYSMQFGLSALICESSSYTVCVRVPMVYYLRLETTAPPGVDKPYAE